MDSIQVARERTSGYKKTNHWTRTESIPKLIDSNSAFFHITLHHQPTSLFYNPLIAKNHDADLR